MTHESVALVQDLAAILLGPASQCGSYGVLLARLSDGLKVRAPTTSSASWPPLSIDSDTVGHSKVLLEHGSSLGAVQIRVDEARWHDVTAYRRHREVPMIVKAMQDHRSRPT
jgi:hypothetical protein